MKNLENALTIGAIVAGATIAAAADSPKLTGTLDNTFSSHYNAMAGFVIGKNDGPMWQPSLGLQYGKINGGIWTDMSMKNGKSIETDLWLGTGGNITTNESFKVNWNVSAQGWYYGGADTLRNAIGNWDGVLHAGIGINSHGFNLDIFSRYVFDNGKHDDGALAHLSLSRPIKLGELGGWNFALTPVVRTAIGADFYGFDGPLMVKYGGHLSASKKKLCIDLGIEQQKGLNINENPTHITGGISYKF